MKWFIIIANNRRVGKVKATHDEIAKHFPKGWTVIENKGDTICIDVHK